MDPRRLLTLAWAGVALSGCALLPGRAPKASLPTAEALLQAAPPSAPTPGSDAADALGPGDLDLPLDTTDAAGIASSPEAARGPAVIGRPAITTANAQARAPSRSDAFVGGVQVFAWSPGRVYEVWTAPLRVTTLTLGPGESLVSKAAGDTVRWQIGETTSGEGTGRRSHVLIKPLERGLETNLVLTTTRRVYFLNLLSGGVEGFNAAIAWDSSGVETDRAARAESRAAVRLPDPVAAPEGPLDARYAIEPRGRRPRWTPTAVFNDGRRTFIAFPADLRIDEAPALFVLTPGGETEMVNYRQAGGLFIVDRVFDRAELRLGDRRPQVVRLVREGGRP